MGQRKMALGAQPRDGTSSSLGTFKALLKSIVTKYVAAEHSCAPPGDGRTWVAVSAHAAEQGRAGYQCPECGQHFSASPKAQAQLGIWRTSLQRAGLAT